MPLAVQDLPAEVLKLSHSTIKVNIIPINLNQDKGSLMTW